MGTRTFLCARKPDGLGMLEFEPEYLKFFLDNLGNRKTCAEIWTEEGFTPISVTLVLIINGENK